MASFGLSTAYLGKGPIRADKSIGCTLRGEPIVIRDTEHSDLLQYPVEARKEGVRAIVSVPIMFNRESIGVLRLYHGEVWDISERDLQSLMVLGENIGLAMMFARLLNAIRLVDDAVREIPMELARLLRDRER